MSRKSRSKRRKRVTHHPQLLQRVWSFQGRGLGIFVTTVCHTWADAFKAVDDSHTTAVARGTVSPGAFLFALEAELANTHCYVTEQASADRHRQRSSGICGYLKHENLWGKHYSVAGIEPCVKKCGDIDCGFRMSFFEMVVLVTKHGTPECLTWLLENCQQVFGMVCPKRLPAYLGLRMSSVAAQRGDTLMLATLQSRGLLSEPAEHPHLGAVANYDYLIYATVIAGKAAAAQWLHEQRFIIPRDLHETALDSRDAGVVRWVKEHTNWDGQTGLSDRLRTKRFVASGEDFWCATITYLHSVRTAPWPADLVKLIAWTAGRRDMLSLLQYAHNEMGAVLPAVWGLRGTGAIFPVRTMQWCLNQGGPWSDSDPSCARIRAWILGKSALDSRQTYRLAYNWAHEQHDCPCDCEDEQSAFITEQEVLAVAVREPYMGHHDDQLDSIHSEEWDQWDDGYDS